MNGLRRAITCGFAGALLLMAAHAASAERPSIGAPAPLPVMSDLAGKERPLKQLAGQRGLVILFWAGWSERSIEALRRLDAAGRELSAHGVSVVAVSVERYEFDAAEAKRLGGLLDKLKLHMPVLVDRGLELFHAYGVVTVPSTAVIDGKGRLAYFLYGYSLEEREELFDAIYAMAGIARRPAPRGSRTAPAAFRRLQLGRFQLSRGHEGPARLSFEAASQADETFADPLVELAALSLDGNDFSTASALLDRAAALDGGHVGVRRERARLAALSGRVAEARLALEELSAKAGDSVAFAYLGYLLRAGGDLASAERAFDRAKGISGIDPRSHVAPGSASAMAAAASAMTAYRREAAPGRR